MPRLAAFSCRPPAQRGFTLLEMLVVLVIVGMLMGLVGPRVYKMLDRGSSTTANAQIRLLRGQVENLRMDIGRYPTAEEGLAVLLKAPADPATAARWRGPYLDDTAVPLDPWGTPYQYSVPGRDGHPYALYSFGADRKAGGSGDDADLGLLPPQ
ncbi:type II secretion system major pseudopilin GspG [Roseateles sp. DB2]|uniref:type II secretion system major pseudopilin GspG n=1 Tax=Roseateles sp. DB2 TaxID=3453717 RepID=UPI003EEE0B1B